MKIKRTQFLVSLLLLTTLLPPATAAILPVHVSTSFHNENWFPLSRDEMREAAIDTALEEISRHGFIAFVDKHDNRNLMLAARNNPQLKTVDALAVNVYDVVDRPHMVVTEEALGRIVEVLSK